MKNKYTLITGTGDFKKLISSNGLSVDSNRLFVDKTLFIKDFLENGAEVLLITRPRRWGKTLALSMLQYFFSEIIDGQPTAGLFQGLKIEKYLEEENPDLKKYQGAHPVISISFKDLKGDSFAEIEKNISKKIMVLFESFKYLLNNNEIKNTFFDLFEDLRKGSIILSNLAFSLLFLSELLYKYHGKKVIVLIDEYDNAINNSYNQPEVVDKLTTFFGNMFGACLKDNKYLEKGLVTGVLRIAKSGMFSGLNNLMEETVLDDSIFAQHYGFTEAEAFEIVSKAGLSTNDVKNWYNGYLIGDQQIYNPWSITHYIHKNGNLKLYWVDTANPEMLKNILITNSKSQQKIKIGNLLRNNTVELESKLKSNVSMADLSFNPEIIWSLMLHAGYLTLCSAGNYKKIRLPNYEIKELIEEYIANWFTENPVFSDAANALLTCNIEGFRDSLKRALLNPAYSARIISNKSVNTFQNIDLKEFMYQFLVMSELRCINEGTTEDYEVIAEPQGISFGQTRPDFIVVHHKHKFCIVGEIKITDRKETLDTAAERAMAQINKNKYGQKYVELGYKLIKIGISFLGAEFEMIWEE